MVRGKIWAIKWDILRRYGTRLIIKWSILRRYGTRQERVAEVSQEDYLFGGGGDDLDILGSIKLVYTILELVNTQTKYTFYKINQYLFYHKKSSTS